MFIDIRLEMIIHSVLLGVLMWFVGFSENGEESIGVYCAVNYIAMVVYTHFKYKGDPEYQEIQAIHHFTLTAEMVTCIIGGLFVAGALEGIFN